MKQVLLRGTSLCTACIFAFTSLYSIPVLANPEGGVVAAGTASITSNANTLDIDQQSDRAVIDWRSFDIQPGEHTQFSQPNSNSVTLNRVGSNAPSAIMGKLTANGNVVVVNPNGVLFGSGAQVDVGGLVATTADIDNDAFMGGSGDFNKAGNHDARVINEGTISAKNAGLVGLVAPTVLNKGTITAKLGRVELASGDTAVIDLYGNNLTGVAISDKVTKQLVSNSGTIDAAGGTIAITAADGRNIVDSLVTIEGELKAPTIAQREGKIIIAAPTGLTGETTSTSSTVNINAALDVSGKNTTEKAGAVHITGKRIALRSGTSIDASGKAGGGEVLIGGDYKGGAYRGNLSAPDASNAKAWGNTPGGYSSVNNSENAAPLAKLYEKSGGKPATASRVSVEKNVTVKASSDGTGNAGRVIYWSDNGTSYEGHTDVSATGTLANAGFVEVSGKDWLNFDGTVNAHAAFGEAGALLLDPADITISNLANSNITGSTPFESSGASTSNLNIGTLQTALGSANVIITSAAGTGGNGDITFVNDLTWSSANSLTVNSSRHITANGNITNSGSGNITLNANINPAANITLNSNISTGGSITALANRDITLAASKTLTSGATGGLSLQAANGVIANAGKLTLDGNLATGTGGLTLRSGINGTRQSITFDSTKLTTLGATIGATNIQGFEDIIIDRNLTSSSGMSFIANRDLTLNGGRSLVTGISGGLTLNAANAVVTNTGLLTLNGNVSAGSGTIGFTSGISAIDGSRNDWVLNSTTMGNTNTAYGAFGIAGFNDITIDRDITSAGGISIITYRDLTLNSGRTLTTGTGGGLILNAAAGVVTNTGTLTINGNMSAGSGTSSLITGISSVDGSRPDITLNNTNLTNINTTFGSVTVSGFNDTTIDRDILSGGSINLNGARNIAISPSRIIRTGATGGLSFQAAAASWSGGATTGPGTINFGGNPIEIGTGNTTLRSGTSTVDGSRPDLTINSTNFVTLGASVGSLTIAGFNDTIIDRDFTTSGLNIISQRNTTLNSGRTVSAAVGTGVSLMSSATTTTGQGILTVDGNIIANTVTLRSGLNPADGTSRSNFTVNSTNINPASAQFVNFGLQGFNILTIDRALVGTGSFAPAANNLVLFRNSINFAGAIIFSGPVQVAEGLSVAIEGLGINFTSGSTTINGTAGGASENLTLNAKTGELSMRGTGNITPFGNLTLIADNMIFNAAITGTGALSIAPTSAGREVRLSTADALGVTTMGLNLNTIEMGNVSGFNNYIYGSSTAGTLTNNKTSWTTPLTFLSGNDIINNAAFTTTGDIFMQAGRDIILNQDIATSSTSSSAINLIAARNFLNNGGTDTLTTGAGGRWIVYSTDRTGTTNEESLAGTFNRYGCTYLSGCAIGVSIPGAGNGFIYSFAPTLTVTGLTANNKIYDTTTAASFSGTAALGGVLSGDTVGLDSSSITAAFADKNAGTGKNVLFTGYTLTGTSLGYLLAQPVLTANITAKALTSSGLSAINKIYDGTLTAALTGTVSLTGILGADIVNASGTAAGTFANKNVGTSKAVTVSGISLAGLDSGNYTVSQPTGLTADITAKALTVSGLTADNKIYDATTAATLSGAASLVGVIGGDTVNVTGGTGNFTDKNVGTGKAVTVAGVSINGADSGNYTVTNPTGLTADITAKALTVSGLTADNKIYDATTTATLSGAASLVGVIGGDTVTTSGITTAAFANKNVGMGKAVTVSGISLAGLDSGNYTVSQPTGLTADIIAKALTVSGLTADNKIYDATTAATLSGAASLVGVIGGDTVNVTGGTGNFTDKNVGTGKAVTVAGVSINGADSGNYTVTNPTGLTANITKAFIDVYANDLSITQGSLPNYSFAYEMAGFRGGENEFTAGITGDASVSSPLQPTTLAAGTYAISLNVNGISAANYQFRERNPKGNLSIIAQTDAPTPPPAPTPALPQTAIALPSTVEKESQIAINTQSSPTQTTTTTQSIETPNTEENESAENTNENMRGLVSIDPYLMEIFGLSSEIVF